MAEHRPMRADARRNRARVVDTAVRVFATEGLSVPVQEIARRAGVGTGTVSRHFPTKEALYEAIVVERVAAIVRDARVAAENLDPGDAFFAFFRRMAEEGNTNRGLAEAFAGVGFDMEAAALRSGFDVTGAWRDLLTRAQRAGAVRTDVDVADVKALLKGCLARERTAPAAEARDRTVSVVCDGLRARPPDRPGAGPPAAA